MSRDDRLLRAFASATKSVGLCTIALLTTALSAGAQRATPTRTVAKPADVSDHRSAFVTHDGVRLHFLDWGGSGSNVVLLPGYGLTAHAFDEIGRLLARDFRVIAVTPRGYGESDAPTDSAKYTVRTMVEDLRALLDSLGIQRAALVGHSISGVTISAFATAYPDRVTRLAFLDAFPYYAAEGGDSIGAMSPVTQHRFSGEMTYPRVRAFLRLYRFSGWSSALEADLGANSLDDMLRRRALTAGYIRDSRAHPPDLSAIHVPSLQLCAMPTTATEYPWLRPGTREHARATAYVRDVFRPFSRRLCTRFSELVPQGRTLDVTGSHYIFFTQPVGTVRALRQFLSE